MAVASALGHQIAARPIIIAGNEWKVRFLQPVRPGDRLVATSECVYKRPSSTKPDRGIARFVVTVQNQKRETVLELESTVVVPKRNQGQAERIHRA
jgi:acyl dehydratase